MKLIALLVALGLERVLTHLLHLRELRWFDAWFDRGLALMARQRGVLRTATAVLVVLLPVLPVAAVALGLLLTGILWDVPYFVFAVLVLLVSLGPRDLGEEVHDYCETVTLDLAERSAHIEKELLETRRAFDGGRRELGVEEAILVQANNRVFGVVLFFMLLGPVGAWLFRVTDLFRRRAVYEHERRRSEAAAAGLASVDRLHGVLAWLPARLAGFGYALAGSFEHALGAWREYRRRAGAGLADVNDEVLAAVGGAALQRDLSDQAPTARVDRCRAAMGLVWRALFLWLTVIALVTLFGWAV